MAPPLPSLIIDIAAPVAVAELTVLVDAVVGALLALNGAVLLIALDDVEVDDMLEVVPLKVLDVDVMVGLGKERDGLADAMLQNCCESCSAEASSDGQVTDMQETIERGNLPCLQKQLTSTTLVQFDVDTAVSRQLTTHVGTPLKLGYCAVLVEVAAVLVL